MTPVRFLPAAELELLREVAYYSKAASGAGIRFNEAVRQAVLLAARQPHGGAPSPANTRSMLVKGFPFSVIYRASDEELLVIAIAPHRRRPQYWLPRAG